MNASTKLWFSFAVTLLFFAANTNAQSLTQTVRGRIIDQDSKSPLPGASVIVLDSKDFLGASTDATGNFRIENVPVGRISLSISYIGYEERVIPNILVTSGKEVVVEFDMRESLINLDELVITSDKDKSRISNEMALISARGFTVEETKRYAGSFNDPARMVSGYAGVSTDASGDNTIIVRGNSPKGIQWRLEGIEIPNPNHFADEGATGGPINALNSIMLANSEFYTGAFAPEYGNALSGVFDMKLRKGNNEKREASLSVGALGVEAGIEGPFKKDSPSSYLVNYRYSSLGLLDNLGLVDFDGVPKYQDLSFKMHLPTKSFGTFSLFGLGGMSNISEEEFAEEDEDKLVEKGNYKANMGVVGLTQYLPLNKNSFLQSTVSVSQNGSGFDLFEPNAEHQLTRLEDMEMNKRTIKAASTLSHKFNARHTLQTGLLYTHHFFDFYYDAFDKVQEEFVRELDMDGDAGHYQGFVSWKFRPWENFSVVSGLHAHALTLNDEVSIEPRASARWNFRPGQAFTAGFGLHGRMDALPNYFSIVRSDNGTASMPNKKMEFSKALHYVAGYENRLSQNLFLKLEAYYQSLYNLPVDKAPGSSYSLINDIGGFTDRALVNEGSGENIGLELTLERYFADSYYFLLTGSLYNSTYKAMDGIERDTRFNGNYAGNLLFGKEFELNARNGKKKTISVNTKISLLGARRFTPIDLQASEAADETIYDESKAYSLRGDNIFIANFALTYRIENRRISQEFKVDIQNATNNAGKIEQFYNSTTNKVEYFDQLPLLPVVMYTIHF